MIEDRSHRKITQEQYILLRIKTWAVAFKTVNNQKWCYIMLLGGKTEETVNKILSL